MFIGAEHSSIRASIYRRGGGPFNLTSELIPLNGRTERDLTPTIVSATIQNALSAGGTWQLAIKMPPGQSLIDQVDDDDWVDIELGRNGVYWHVMRGMVDEVREDISIGGNGTTTYNYLLVGSSFQKVWHNSLMWFSAIRGENYLLQDVLLRDALGKDLPETIASYLYIYTNELAQKRRASVTLPAYMYVASQNTVGEKSFADAWVQDDTGYDRLSNPKINSSQPTLFAPNQSVWEVAQFWADPMFCELFTELLPEVPKILAPGQMTVLEDFRNQKVCATSAMGAMGQDPLNRGMASNQSQMTVVIRDKPFIELARDQKDLGGSTAKTGLLSPWFSLPTYVIPTNHIVNQNLGRSGIERHNAFLCALMAHDQGASVSTRVASAPLWDEGDIEVHGMRMMDCMTMYRPSRAADVYYERRMRARLRDWYMAGPYYLQGTISLGRGYPQMKVGTRLCVPGSNDRDRMMFYVEGVSHTYSVIQGIRTTATVTRGYRGTDTNHLAFLNTLAQRYTAPDK